MAGRTSPSLGLLSDTDLCSLLKLKLHVKTPKEGFGGPLDLSVSLPDVITLEHNTTTNQKASL